MDDLGASDPIADGPDREGLTEPPPPVWKWFRVYCFAMALLYLLCFGVGLALMLLRGFFAKEAKEDPAVILFVGGIYALIGLVCLLIFAVAPFLPRRKWVWVYDLVLICLGMTSICCMPACIPLLIFWIRPETKAYFGMKS